MLISICGRRGLEEERRPHPHSRLYAVKWADPLGLWQPTSNAPAELEVHTSPLAATNAVDDVAIRGGDRPPPNLQRGGIVLPAGETLGTAGNNGSRCSKNGVWREGWACPIPAGADRSSRGRRTTGTSKPALERLLTWQVSCHAQWVTDARGKA